MEKWSWVRLGFLRRRCRVPGVRVSDAGRSKAELVAEIETLREAESRLGRIARHASDVLAEIDAEGRFLYVSPNCETVLGFPVSEFLGVDARDSAIARNVHPEDNDRVFAFDRFDPTGAPPDAELFRYRHADGRWRWLESRWQPFQADNGEWRAIIVSRDVTDREQTVSLLRQSEERYRVLSETTSELVAELDAEGRLLFASPSLEQVLGYHPRELVGTTPFGLLHPEQVEPLAERFLERLSATRSGERTEIFRVRHRDGSWRWLQGGGVNFETAARETHVVAVMRDVTEQLQQEEERSKLEERVQEMQKLESLGVMAGGIAHDFNNLLTPILGDSSLALMELPQNSEVRMRIERIQRAAHHAATLTHQLLDYAGMGALDIEPVDLSKLVREMVELLQSAVSRHAVLVYDLGEDLPSVRGDPRLLSQVVMNLLTNASEAVEARPEGGGHISVRSGIQQVSEAGRAHFLLGEDIAVGQYVYLEIEDAGCGMSEENRARIFDPFFSTKFTGRGLGLATVLGIVRKHAGAIEIESEPERGTRIRILCPSAGGQDAARAAPRPDFGAWEAEGSVLVADDDEGAREVLEEVLARAGFRVLSAADGEEAVETFRRHAEEIRVVLLDRTMPGTSGEEAFDAIRAVSSHVPILLVSGYSRESAQSQLEGDPHSGFLQKPFLPETLLEKVRELLSG